MAHIDVNGMVVFTDREQETLDSFNYHRPNEAQAGRIENIRSICRTAAAGIMLNVPECADRTVSLRKLHEAMMNANKAIVLEKPQG